jgi:hypothetical protein
VTSTSSVDDTGTGMTRKQRFAVVAIIVGAVLFFGALAFTAVYSFGWFSHRSAETCDVTSVSGLEHTSKGRDFWAVKSSCGDLELSPQAGGINDASALALAQYLRTPGQYRLTIQGFGNGEKPITAAAWTGK